MIFAVCQPLGDFFLQGFYLYFVYLRFFVLLVIGPYGFRTRLWLRAFTSHDMPSIRHS